MRVILQFVWDILFSTYLIQTILSHQNWNLIKLWGYQGHIDFTAVQLVYNPLNQFVSEAQFCSQLQLSLWCDPIAMYDPISI